MATTTTIKAIAVKAGYIDSNIYTAKYVIDAGGSITAPVITPAGATALGSQLVSITDTDSSLAIYYTTDGTIPTSTSTLYEESILITQSCTLKAIAISAGGYTSDVVAEEFTILAGPPIFSPAAGTYIDGQSLSITSPTTDASIYYTMDGSTPTANSTLYTGNLVLSAPVTFLAIAINSIGSSSISTSAYSIKTKTPTISVASGTVTDTFSTAVACASLGAIIYYTTDGSDVTVNSAQCNGTISIGKSCTLRVRARKPGCLLSDEATATYVLKTATPTASLPGGTYPLSKSVTLRDTTSNAAIYYTLDGSTPSIVSLRYSNAIAIVNGTTTLKAIALRAGCLDSDMLSVTYVVQATVENHFKIYDFELGPKDITSDMQRLL